MPCCEFRLLGICVCFIIVWSLFMSWARHKVYFLQWFLLLNRILISVSQKVFSDKGVSSDGFEKCVSLWTVGGYEASLIVQCANGNTSRGPGQLNCFYRCVWCCWVHFPSASARGRNTWAGFNRGNYLGPDWLLKDTRSLRKSYVWQASSLFVARPSEYKAS